MKLSFTEQICNLKQIGTRKRPIDIGVLRKQFEPITLECATHTLNTSSVKSFKPFFNVDLFWLFSEHGINFYLEQLMYDPLSIPDPFSK